MNQQTEGNCRACNGTGLQTRKIDGLTVKCPVCHGTKYDNQKEFEIVADKIIEKYRKAWEELKKEKTNPRNTEKNQKKRNRKKKPPFTSWN